MRPIRDIADLAAGAVVHHSAFGFARVRAIEADEAQLSWESDDANLPAAVSSKSLRKAYSLCSPDGFFARAMTDRDALSEDLHVAPTAIMKCLLRDLGGPQRTADLKDWVIGRALMSSDAFDRWWSAAVPVIREDTELALEGDVLRLSDAAIDDVGTRLSDPTLSPSRRLDLAMDHSRSLPPTTLDAALFQAWIDGTRQVRDQALHALADRSGDAVVEGLLAGDGSPTEALIHAVRQGPWKADAVSVESHHSLGQLLARAVRRGGPLDAEGRLAAALYRWGSPVVADLLSEAAANDDGQRLVRATLSALPQSRAVELAVQLLSRAVGRTDTLAASWLSAELLEGLEPDEDQLAAVLESQPPSVSSWLAEHYEPDASLEEDGITAELDLAAFLTEAVPVSQLPPQSGMSFIAVGLSLARALAAAHNAGLVVNPTRDSVWLEPDGTVEFRQSRPSSARRPPNEEPSKTGDVYACAVLLLETLIGRPWPEGIDPALAIPYLRGAVPDLPPSALAPLDAALHPDRGCRPRDGLSWQVSWQATALAEDSRNHATLDETGRIDVGYDSHVGRMKILYTQTNQDALFVAERSGVTLLVVCDGISTATAGSGDVAAGITAHVVSSLWEQALTRLRDATVTETEDFLARAFRMANQAVCEAALRFAGGRLHGRVPMGTTAVVGISRGNRVTLAWLGDSRAYVVGPYGASLLTADMNQAGDRMVGWTRGDLPRWDPNGYALVGYIGHFDESYTAIPLQPAVIDILLLPGERLVICSDGVTDYAAPNHPETANRIARSVLNRPCDEAARALVELANRGGGGDNATAIVANLRG